MDHNEIKQLLPLAALGQITPDEERELEDHLRGCDECPAELQAYREVAAAIPLAEEPLSPHDRIWARLEARLAAERHDTSAAGPAEREPATVSGTSRRPGSRSGWHIATGLAAAAAIVAVIYADQLSTQLSQRDAVDRAQVIALQSEIAHLQSDLGQSRVRMASLQQMLANREGLQRVLLAPDVSLIRLAPLPAAPNANAIVAISQSHGGAAIEARGLPPTPAGKIYELWWITKETGPIPAGLFSTGATGSATAKVSPPPSGQHLLLSAVTLEPVPGVPKPTGAMYLKGAPG
jgi:anti-sigma-K factor RskA